MAVFGPGTIVDMATIERGRYQFRVAEFHDGEPWIMTDPMKTEDRLSALGKNGFIGFDLKPGTTYKEAEKIAEYLNEHIASITCTL
jgi:hypothetical protein